MTDRFKEHINANKAKLDIRIPDTALWDDINSKINGGRTGHGKVFLFFRAMVAACFIALAATGAYYLIFIKSKVEQHAGIEIEPANTDVVTAKLPEKLPALIETGKVEVQSKPSIKKSAAERTAKPVKQRNDSEEKNSAVPLADVEAAYTAIINDKIRRINVTPVFVNDSSYFNLHRAQLQQFSSMAEQLKEELRLFGVDDSKLEAMIMIYKKKAELLERLLEEIKRMNTNPEQSKPVYLKL